MTWSDKTWQEAIPVYNSIISMPYIDELMQGTLPMEKFKFYIAQDAIYLDNFARALAIIGARANGIEDALAFIRFAEGAITVENVLHQSYFTEYQIDENMVAEPACHHYLHYLKSTAALAPVEVAMAAVLPCFWIYKKVGDYIYQNQHKIDNKYQKWIDTYAGEAFGILVDKAIAICDSVAANCTLNQQTAMTEAFVTASKLEYHFWDGAYHLRKW